MEQSFILFLLPEDDSGGFVGPLQPKRLQSQNWGLVKRRSRHCQLGWRRRRLCPPPEAEGHILIVIIIITTTTHISDGDDSDHRTVRAPCLGIGGWSHLLLLLIRLGDLDLVLGDSVVILVGGGSGSERRVGCQRRQPIGHLEFLERMGRMSYEKGRKTDRKT
jgi:hypothetical protein